MTQTTYETCPSTQSPARAGGLRQIARDSYYLLTGLPLALVSFTVLITLTLVSASVLVLWVGLPLLAFSLLVARGFAAVESERLRGRGLVVHRAARNGRSGWLEQVRDRRSWVDLGHGLIALPVTLLTWSIALVWWAGAIGGLSYPLWRWTLPDGAEDESLAELIGIGYAGGDIALNLVIGVAFAVTLAPVVRALAGTQATFARTLLDDGE